MIYIYTLKSNFLEDLMKNYSMQDAFKFLNFFQVNFIEKENMFFSSSENIFINYGEGENKGIIDEILKNISNQRTAIKGEADFCLTSKYKDPSRTVNISMKDIIDDEKKLSQKIKENSKDYLKIGNGDKKIKRKLESAIKRIFKFSQKIYLVDRYIPDHYYKENLKVKEYNHSFQFLSRISKMYQSDLDIIASLSYNMKRIWKYEDIETKMYRIIDHFSPKKISLKIKDSSTWKELHKRWIISICEDEINIFEDSEGLNFIKDGKSNLSGPSNRHLYRHQLQLVNELYPSLKNKVENDENYLEIAS